MGALLLARDGRPADDAREAALAPQEADTPSLQLAGLTDASVPDPSTTLRPVFRYSVIPGGAYDAQELGEAVGRDAVVATAYRDFAGGAVHPEIVSADRLAYMSYRIGDQIYWTKHKIQLRRGETILTDGHAEVRARCGNGISVDPMLPTADTEPAPLELDALAVGEAPLLASRPIGVATVSPVAPSAIVPARADAGAALAAASLSGGRLAPPDALMLTPGGDSAQLPDDLAIKSGEPADSPLDVSPAPSGPAPSGPGPEGEPAAGPATQPPAPDVVFAKLLLHDSGTDLDRPFIGGPGDPDQLFGGGPADSGVDGDPPKFRNTPGDDHPGSDDPLTAVSTPEPGTLLLLGSGLAGVALRKRSSRRRRADRPALE